MQHYSQDTVVVEKKAVSGHPSLAKCSPEHTLLQDHPASECASGRQGFSAARPKTFKAGSGTKPALVLSYSGPEEEEDSGKSPVGLRLLQEGRTPSTGTQAPEGTADKDEGKNFTETENSVSRLLMKKEKFVLRQAAIDISGVQVHFPFKPYGCQIEYMNRVMQALNEGKNALLESPTGTGKTLSLLCATLAWVRHQRELEAQQHQSGEKASGDTDERPTGGGHAGVASGSFVPDFNLPLGPVGGAAQPPSGHNLNGKKPQAPSTQRHQIIYCSRTISQLSQVINELKSTAYDPKSVILASRDHTCVNPNLQEFKGYNLQNRCNRAIKSRKCEFFHEYSQRTQIVPTNEPYDIEDLHQIARELTICPFYMNRERSGTADLILMSYNYMLYESMRPNNTLNYTDSIIVFDEAHNVPKCAEDAASFQLETDALLQLVFTLKNLQDAIQHSKQKFSSTINDIEGIRSITSGFLNYLQDYDFGSNEHDQERIQNSFLDRSKLAIPGHCIFNIFFQGINSERHCQDFEEHIFQSHWESFWVRAFKRALADFSENYYDCSTLHNWFQFIQKVISFQGRFEDIHDYYVLLQETDAKKDSKLHLLNQSRQQGYNGVYVGAQTGTGFDTTKLNNAGNTTVPGPGQPYISTLPAGAAAAQMTNRPVKNRILKFLCFNAGVCFNQIQRLQPRSIILTSGTLAPLQSFQAELQIDFKQNLENPHVISSDQVLISILKRGVDGQLFDLSYKNRESHGMIADLGRTIARVAALTPGGMLVFFPSYGLMEQCFDVWERNGVTPLIAREKRLFKEPKDPKEYQLIIQKYYQAIFQDEARGSILMGVCRGRISEGLDFSDNAARCVVLVGIPYPQMADPIVILKKEYLQKKNQVNKIGLTGSQWYSQQATRAVNQAIGRVIRHVQDYGAIILMDHRYAYQSGKSQISKWLRDLITVNQSFSSGLDPQMRQFYAVMGQRSFVPKLKQLEQLQLELDNDEENLKIKNGLLNRPPQYSLKAIDQAGKFRHLRAQLGARVTPALTNGLKVDRADKYDSIIVQNKRRRHVTHRDSIDDLRAEGALNAPQNLRHGSQASMNTMLYESTMLGGQNNAKSSPTGFIAVPRAKASPTTLLVNNHQRGHTNVTTAVCSGGASCKVEGLRGSPQKRLHHAVKKHCLQNGQSDLCPSTPSDHDSKESRTKKAPVLRKKFAAEQNDEDKEKEPCACSEMQIKNILAGGDQEFCSQCKRILQERFGGGRPSQSSRKRKHRTFTRHKHQQQRRSKSSGSSHSPTENDGGDDMGSQRSKQEKVSSSRGSHHSSSSSSSPVNAASEQVLPSSGTEKYYVLGQPQTMIHEFYPAHELNAAFDNDQLCLNNSSHNDEESSARVLNLRRRRCLMKQQVVEPQQPVLLQTEQSEDVSSSLFETQQHMTGKSEEDGEVLSPRSPDLSDSHEQPVVMKSGGRRAKIPVVIPYPRDHNAKPKVKYNRVGQNYKPFGFKLPESGEEDTEECLLKADLPEASESNQNPVIIGSQTAQQYDNELKQQQQQQPHQRSTSGTKPASSDFTKSQMSIFQFFGKKNQN